MKTFQKEKYIKDGLSLHIFKSNGVRTEPLHDHDFVEIVYVTDGEAIEVINGISYEARRGDLLFINYRSTHTFIPKSKFTYYNICFNPEIIAERIITRENAFDLLSLTAIEELSGEGFADGVMHFSGLEREKLESLLSDMHEEYRVALPERAAALESYMTLLLTKILRKAHPNEKEKREVDGIWQKLSDYISESLSEKLTLCAIANKCFYNPSYFSRAFKERFGMTFIEYVSRKRASEAAKLLYESDLSSDEICQRCGFGDRTSFYRVFKKEYGISPGEYREQERRKHLVE